MRDSSDKRNTVWIRNKVCLPFAPDFATGCFVLWTPSAGGLMSAAATEAHFVSTVVICWPCRLPVIWLNVLLLGNPCSPEAQTLKHSNTGNSSDSTATRGWTQENTKNTGGEIIERLILSLWQQFLLLQTRWIWNIFRLLLNSLSGFCTLVLMCFLYKNLKSFCWATEDNFNIEIYSFATSSLDSLINFNLKK